MTSDSNQARPAADYKYLRSAPERSIGSFVRSDEWSGYWRTAVGDARGGEVLIRGYDVADVIDELTFVEASYLVIRGELPTKTQAEVFDLLLRSTLEHGFVVASSCAARFVASAVPEAPAAAIGAGVLAHGSVTGSPHLVAEMVVDVMSGGEAELEARIDELITIARAEGRLIPGLGHPVHKIEEPRAVAIRRGLERLGAVGPHSEAMRLIRERFVAQTGIQVPINVDGELGSALVDIGFTPREATGIGIFSFMPGIIAHTVEEIDSGVPLRFIPDQFGVEYVGESRRELVADRAPEGPSNHGASARQGD